MASTRDPRFRQGTSAERATISAGLLNLGTVWHETDTGDYYGVALNLANTHVYVAMGGSASGTSLLYVVAEAGTPMATTGTFPTVEAAVAQAQADFGVNPLNAAFIVMPGTYPGFRLRPGMHVALVVEGGVQLGMIPPVPSLDTPPFTITGTVQILAADGWDPLPGAPLPNASIAGALFDTGAATCLEINGPVTAGTVSIAQSVLRTTGIAIDEVAPGPYSATALMLMLETTHAEAFGSISFNGSNTRLVCFAGCRFQGAVLTQQVEGVTFQNSFLVFAYVTASVNAAILGTGSVNARFVGSTLISVDGNAVANRWSGGIHSTNSF